VTLLARRHTDALLVGVARWPAGLFADPTEVEGRAAWYSFAFWLRQAACARLDVDTLELDAGFRALSHNGRPIGQAFLSDRLENGAGYCRELARTEQFRALLGHVAWDEMDSIAAMWTDVTEMAGAAPPHGLECDTSCNRCLRDFANLPYHGLLDWRIALDMARIASAGDAVIDLDTPWGERDNPWRRLSIGARAPLPAALQHLHYGPAESFDSLRGYVHSKRRRILIERHPLWQDDHDGWQRAVKEAHRRYHDHDVMAANPFRLLRRPGEFA
jgi:hypothetical protein